MRGPGRCGAGAWTGTASASLPVLMFEVFHNKSPASYLQEQEGRLPRESQTHAPGPGAMLRTVTQVRTRMCTFWASGLRCSLSPSGRHILEAVERRGLTSSSTVWRSKVIQRGSRGGGRSPAAGDWTFSRRLLCAFYLVGSCHPRSRFSPENSPNHKGFSLRS